MNKLDYINLYNHEEVMLKSKEIEEIEGSLEKLIYFYKDSEKRIVYDVLENEGDIRRIRRAVPLT